MVGYFNKEVTLLHRIYNESAQFLGFQGFNYGQTPLPSVQEDGNNINKIILDGIYNPSNINKEL